MIECPSCGTRQEPLLTCAECGAPLAASLDCFAALGLPRGLTIDPDALERRYHELSRKVHPDRFASSKPKVRDASLRATATLTRSYRTLRDPVARALYWLELNGEKLADNNQRVPPEVAELVFDVQEQLAEMQLASNPEAAVERSTEVAARRVQLQFAMDEKLAQLERHFARWTEAADQKMLNQELKPILSNIAYLRTLIRDVDRALENSKAA
jgi:molecular chaperone HscB